MDVYFDTETRSGADLSEVGTTKYLADPQAGLICLAYSINKAKPKLWLPGNPVPECFANTEGNTYIAHNIQFDQRVINTLGRAWGFARLSIKKCVDAMALAARFTFPQSLDQLGKVLGLDTLKMESGKRLKKLLCMPPFVASKEDTEEFYVYCLVDVATMVKAISALPSERLSEDEQQIWLDTVAINVRGIPIDIHAAARIDATVKFYMAKRTKALPILTGGAVQKATQVKRIREWMWDEHGIQVDNLQAKTVEELLDSTQVPTEVKEVLQIRQDIGGAAVKKYRRLIGQTIYGRIFQNLRYGAASTLRFGGLGFQVHNMPRASVNNPDAAIKMFESSDIMFKNYSEQDKDEPTLWHEHSLMYCAKALIRPMIKASKGMVLMAADYASIEAVFLMWMAGESKALDLIRRGFDLYKDMASYLYQIPYEDVNSHQRFLGKTLILGAGYQLGWKGFIAYAQAFGLHITPEQAQHAINSYRAKYKGVVALWYGLSNAAGEAIRNPGATIGYRNNRFKVLHDRNGVKWLKYQLPSGRANFYNKPHIAQGNYGDSIFHYGLNSMTKQWSRKELTPGRLTENGDQAISRDRLCHGVRCLIADGFHPIFHVHDEVVTEEKEGSKTLERMIGMMCANPEWCIDLPISADGYVSQRYKKG